MLDLARRTEDSVSTALLESNVMRITFELARGEATSGAGCRFTACQLKCDAHHI